MFTLIILIIIIKAAAASAGFRDRGTPDHTPLSTYLHNYLLYLVSTVILTSFHFPEDRILILILWFMRRKICSQPHDCRYLSHHFPMLTIQMLLFISPRFKNHFILKVCQYLHWCHVSRLQAPPMDIFNCCLTTEQRNQYLHLLIYTLRWGVVYLLVQ